MDDADHANRGHSRKCPQEGCGYVAEAMQFDVVAGLISGHIRRRHPELLA